MSDTPGRAHAFSGDIQANIQALIVPNGVPSWAADTVPDMEA